MAMPSNNLDLFLSTVGRKPKERKVEQPKVHECIQNSAQICTGLTSVHFVYKYINTRSNLLTSFEARFTMCPIER